MVLEAQDQARRKRHAPLKPKTLGAMDIVIACGREGKIHRVDPKFTS
jgi:hypothetical protein